MLIKNPLGRILILALGVSATLSALAPPLARARAPEAGETGEVGNTAEPARTAAAEAPAAAPEPPVLHTDVSLAERHAAAAFEAYRARDYVSAINLYEQALAAAPSAEILYNIARVYDVGLRERARSIEYYERYRAHPNATPELFETATRRVAELRALEAATSGAASDATSAITRDFPLDSSERLSIAPAAQAADRGVRPLEVTALTFGAAGLVGIGLGIGFGLSARAEADTWERDCNGNQCTSQRGVDAAEAALHSADVATVSFAVGGGLLAVGAVLWLVDSDGAQPGRAASVSIAPALGSSSLGGTLHGRF